MKYLFLKLAAAAALALALACGGESNPPVLNNVPVAGVAIEGKVPRMTVGEKLTVNAMLMPARATNREVSWASSDTHVASVGGSGQGATVSAVGAGEVSITVKTTEGGFTDTFRMFVSDGSVAVAGLSLDRTTMALVPGGSAVLVASLWPSDATDQGIAWDSSNKSAATVVGSGANAMVTAIANGSSVITARTSDGGFTATCTVTVAPYTVPVTDIALNNTSLEVIIGNAASTLTATITPPNAPPTVSWTSSATGVATVSGTGIIGTVTPVGVGFTTITATAGGKSATCAVTVRTVPVTGVTLPATKEVPVGGTATLTATILPSNATNRGVTWSSSNNAIATVTGTGVLGTVTGVALGNATITARTDEGGFSATCAVTVTEAATHHTIAASQQHSVAIKADGSLWAWGRNTYGQCGNGKTGSNQLVPDMAGTDKDWVHVAAGGESYTMAIKSNGTLWAFGRNLYGQLGIGNFTNQSVPVQVGTDSDWATVACGNSHTVALKKDGSLWVWGWNMYGQLGTGEVGGETTRTTPYQLGTAKDWAAVAAGFVHTLALKKDGSLWAWGVDNNGQIGNDRVGSPLFGDSYCAISPVRVGTSNDWESVLAGAFHTVATRKDGSLWGWGANQRCQLGIGGATPTNQTTPIRVGVGSDWAGCLSLTKTAGEHTPAVKSDGSLWAWGYNNYRQVGNNSTTDQPTPLRVGTDNNWVAAAGGDFHTLTLKSDGSIWTWGRNNYGQIGNGAATNVNQNTPVQIATGFRVPGN